MTTAYPEQAGHEVAPIQRPWLGPFITAAMGTFMATLDGSIVSVALPSIAESLHAPVDDVAWVMLAYTLTLISLMIVFGAWIDRRGFRFGYHLGFTFFLAGSVACSLSTSLWMLVAGRVVQGIGTAIFAGVGPGMVATIFPEEKRGKGIGLMIMTVSAGFSMGYPLGGMLIKFFPWQSLFLVNVPIAIAGFVMVEKFLGHFKPKENPKPLPLGSAFAIAVALVSFTYALTLIDKGRGGVPFIVGLMLLSLVSAFLFIRLESDEKNALLGLALFSRPRFRLALLSQTTQFVGTAGAFFLLPFYFRQVRGFDAMSTGLYLLMVPVGMFISAPLAGKLTDKVGARMPVLIGVTLTLVGLGLMFSFEQETAGWFLVVTLLLLGFGAGGFGTPNATEMMSSVEPSKRAAASSILATNRNIGFAVGIALASGLFALVNGRVPAAQISFSHYHAGITPVLIFSLSVVGIGFVLGLMRQSKV